MSDFDLDEMELDVLRRDVLRLKNRQFCRRDLRLLRDLAATLIEIANASEAANANR